MKLKNMTKEEIELLSYTDLTSLLLEENNSSMKTATIFKKICDLLNYSEKEYEDKIGDYYTSLTIDKRFVLLDNQEWDLRERHAVAIVLDDMDEEDVIIDEEEEPVEEEDEEEVITEEEDIDDVNDDMEDLTIIGEDEENI